MGSKNVQKTITLVLSISFVALFFKVTANENFQQHVPCKPGWYNFGENCYKIFPSGTDPDLNWADSENSCIMKGGHLASIHSNELQEFLLSTLLLNSKTNAWIGLHDRVRESEFSWVDESANNYNNWDANEPSRSYGRNEEDCVEIRFNGLERKTGPWNDESCKSLRPYVCQVNKSDDTKSPDPRFCSLEDGGGWKYLIFCYHIVKEEKSWEDAEKYCEENYRGYLVSILNDRDEVYLDYMMKISNFSENIWIGIKMENESMQNWASGWHVANKKVNQKQLNFVNGTCVMKSNWNAWGIDPCHNKHQFICEKVKYNVPVLQKPPSDNWKCPQSSKKWLDFGGNSCYYIENSVSREWIEANYECGKIGGTLASFHSENETNILHPHVLNTQKRLFIGLKRNSERNDIFEWADGTHLNYINWNEKEPNYLHEMCGELWTGSMKWNDISCNIPKGYICKTKKVYTYSKMEEVSKYVPCNSTLSKEQTYSRLVPAGIVVVIVICTLIVSLLVGVIIYHYQDCWKQYCTKTDKGDFMSISENPLLTFQTKCFGSYKKNTIKF